MATDAPYDMTGAEAQLVGAIEGHGFTVRFVDYCEDARTPGLLGQIAGVTDRDRREVKIGLVATGRAGNRTEVLGHELRHVLEPGWDCGNRDVLGRGGPRLPEFPATCTADPADAKCEMAGCPVHDPGGQP